MESLQIVKAEEFLHDSDSDSQSSSHLGDHRMSPVTVLPHSGGRFTGIDWSGKLSNIRNMYASYLPGGKDQGRCVSDDISRSNSKTHT